MRAIIMLGCFCCVSLSFYQRDWMTKCFTQELLLLSCFHGNGSTPGELKASVFLHSSWTQYMGHSSEMTTKVDQFSTFLCSVGSLRVYVYKLEISHEQIILFACWDECKQLLPHRTNSREMVYATWTTAQGGILWGANPSALNWNLNVNSG